MNKTIQELINELPEGCEATVEHCKLHARNAINELSEMEFDPEQLTDDLAIASKIAEILVLQKKPKYNKNEVVWVKEFKGDNVTVPRQKGRIVGDGYPTGTPEDFMIMYVVSFEPGFGYDDGLADVSEDQIESTVIEADRLDREIDRVYQGCAPDMDNSNFELAAETIADVFDTHCTKESSYELWKTLDNKLDRVKSVLTNYF